ncbi:MAG: cytochrome P450 [Anaerolineae bacterium]|nr:cytochrome P450 [Anaerolineae bacterium]
MTILAPPSQPIAAKPILGPRGYPFVGSLPHMAKDMLGFLRSIPQNYGGVARLRLGPANFVLVADPYAVKYCLIDNNKNYPKNYASTAKLFGEGLLSSNGEFWLRQRRLMQPAFHQREIAKFGEVMVSRAEQMVAGWRSGQPLFILQEMMQVTQTVILQVMFSANIGERTAEMGRAFDDIVAHLGRAAFSPIKLPFADRKFKAAVQKIDAFLYDLIAERRRNLENAPADLLTTLITATDPETGQGMNDKQLRDEMLTLYFAGHETTATTLGWTLSFLAQNPQVEANIRAEITSVLGGRRVAMEDWPKLNYTRRVIDETLRMRSPAWMFTREAKEDDVVNGHAIAKGQVMMFSPYITHHLPEFWPDPERFDPDRFLPAAEATRPKTAYMPFSVGPRMCIGNIFALVESCLMLVTMMQAGKLQPIGEVSLTPQPGVVLRPSSKMQMRFEM